MTEPLDIDALGALLAAAERTGLAEDYADLVNAASLPRLLACYRAAAEMCAALEDDEDPDSRPTIARQRAAHERLRAIVTGEDGDG